MCHVDYYLILSVSQTNMRGKKKKRLSKANKNVWKEIFQDAEVLSGCGMMKFFPSNFANMFMFSNFSV